MTIGISILFHEWYAMVEIGITRFLPFLFGAWAAGRIYRQQDIHCIVWILVGIPARLLSLGIKSVFPGAAFIFGIEYPINRWIISWCGTAIMMICVLLLHWIKNSHLHHALSVVGSYSLELYIVHVSVRTVMNTNQFGNYLIVIIISVIISILLKLATNKILILFQSPKKES